MALALLYAGFQSLPLLPTIKLGPSGADSRVGKLVHALGPCGSLQWTLLWSWEFFLRLPLPPQVFSISGLRLYFPVLELWVVQSVTWSTSCCLAGQLQLCPPRSTILILVCQPQPCCESSLPSCLAPPLLQVWMNVSSLSHWLSDFHTVRFSVSYGFFCF